jgi:K+-sensing histidine kinase KdpD
MSTQVTYDTTIFPPAAQSELVVVPLERVLGEVRPLVERVGARKRVAITFDTDEHLPTAARNELPLMRLCYLLIARAISVTPPYGVVRVAASVLPGGEPAGVQRSVQVGVWDAGMGITASDFERVFQDFEPLDVMRAEGCYGMTVGCRLAHLPGARLSMNANWGQGCTFTIKLPAA